MQFSFRRFVRLGFLIVGLALLAGFASACTAENNIPIIVSPSVIMRASPARTDPVVNTNPAPTRLPPTQTSEPLAEACLIGSWTVADLQETVMESYTRSQSSLLIQTVEGETRYTFHDDGGMEIVFDDLIATMAGNIEGKQMVARNVFVGMATAQYRLNVKNREIVFSTFGGDGIQFATEINGQVLAQGNFPAWRAFSSNLAASSPSLPLAGPTRIVQEAYAVVECSGDQMRLQAIDPIPGPEVKLRRIMID